MAGWHWHPIAWAAEFHHERESRRLDMRHLEDAQSAHFQQSRQSWRRPCHAGEDFHPVIRYQVEAASEQTQKQV
jgi:hypothetical protein